MTLFGHGMPLAPVFAPLDTNGIVNGTTEFVKDDQMRCSVTFLVR